MASPEPSFEGFFSTQQRPSAQNSFDLPSKTTYASGSGDNNFGDFYEEEPAQYAEEPQSMAAARDPRMDHMRGNDNPTRKDSVPFDPSSSSTLISSVNGHSSHPGTPGYPYDYQGSSPGLAQHPMQQQQQMAYMHHQAGMGGDMYNSGSASQSGDWNNEFLGQQEGHHSNAGSRRASFNGGLAGNFDDQQQYNELQRIMSNASRSGTPGPDHSRAASPFVQGEGQWPDSASTNGRSPSPFAPSMAVAAPSPPIHRPGSAADSPSSFSNKPQSPPALVIPNQSASTTQFQTIAAAAPPQRSTGQFGNSLLPPANPALSGMAGISPIDANADGPMITIQPSTPISGLKEGNGLFDAALRRANQQSQIAQANARLAQNGQGQAMGNSQTGGPGAPSHDGQQWGPEGLNAGQQGGRPRARSESYTTSGDQFERQAMYQVMGNPAMAGHFEGAAHGMHPQHMESTQDQWINAWRMNNAAAEQPGQPTVDPRQLPGTERAHSPHPPHGLGQINTAAASGQAFKYESGQISPTSMAVYQQLGLQTGGSGGTANSSPGYMYQPGIAQPVPQAGFLIPEGGAVRRRSFAEGSSHPAAGAGTPGYGVEFSMPGAFTPPHRLRGGQFGPGGGHHRRAVRSEDFSRFGPGTGWGVGQGGSTTDFLHSITNPDDGTLLPPSRGRSNSNHSRHSSVSSVRSASPALSVSSQGSSFSHHSHMDMPEHMQDFFDNRDNRPRVSKLKVTSMATELASQSRRTNSGSFKCPIPGCGSTFTRHFNLKGHLRSHNDERPYKCWYEGCPKAVVGFARQHDCKRHMLLHEGLRPFECEGCGKKFARLDALTRHHKSEQGQECAISHPLPTNPDGSAMSESQYKAYRLQAMKDKGIPMQMEPGDPTLVMPKQEV